MRAVRSFVGRAMLAASACMLAGCIVPGLQSFVTRPSSNLVSVSLRTSATHSPCEITARSGAHLRHDCDYSIAGRAKLARVFLQDNATVEALVDPVILQVPDPAGGVGGIFGYDLANGTLAVTESSATCMRTSPGRSFPSPATSW